MKVIAFSAVALLILFESAAAAESKWYVVTNLATGKCATMQNPPDTSKYKLLGSFPTRQAAESAMHNMSGCQ